MRLALVTQDFLPEVGGIQTYSYELALRLHEKCEHFMVVAPACKGAAETDRRLPYPVYRVKARNDLLGLAAIPMLPAYWNKMNIDTVFHAQWQSLPVSVLAKKAGTIKHLFVAAHARELLFNPLKKSILPEQWYDRYRDYLLDKVDHFFPVSDFTAELIHQLNIDHQKITTVINGTDPDKFYPKKVPGLQKKWGLKNERILMTITRLNARKGIDTVLKSLPNILERFPDLTYVIVGAGEFEPRLRALVRDLNLGNAVIFTGRVSYEELNDYYNLCDLFVMPSISDYPNVEGFGIVFLEANACEKPVIGSTSGGIPSAVLDGETGLLVEERNPARLSRAVIELLSDPARMRSMGKKGRERVLEEANWNAVSDKLFNRMKQIIE